jgi:hypothetical protein
MQQTKPAELRASTVETVFKLLETQLEFRHVWVKRFFPAVADRECVEYSDIDEMSAAQADALRHLLLEQEAYGWKRVRRHPPILPEPDEEVKEWKLRIGMYREAVADICDTFGLPMPKAV